MSVRRIIKSIVIVFHCLLFRLDYKEGLYIGFGSKIVGTRKYILLNEYCDIHPRSMIVSLRGGRIEIGKGASVSMYSRVAAMGCVKIEDWVEMGPGCFIADYNHAYEDISRPVKLQDNSFIPKENKEPNLTIGEGSWVGAHAVIVGNVKIGKHCVIGANSVVTHDLPDFCVAVGAPARIIKRYNFYNKQWERI